MRSGERIGPFELVRPLGHGGPGEAWLARQADGRIAREVALKLPAQARPQARERFLRERNTLARLEHPHIARLYDAGETEAGQPWIAMEHVEGLPLLDHVAARSLALPQRLALFRQVLAAVAHAHRSLVAHGALQPASILVDAAGRVRVLDFGVADAASEGAGTGADIRALGAILQALREGLASRDLDAIVDKATREDAAGRYATVGQLDEDVAAHLARRPVGARPASWRYVAGRFAMRHQLSLALCAAVLASALAGLGIAERERRAALAEKARAERHFASVRRLANAFMFDVHREIENVAGSLKARQMLVATAVEYLDGLAAESGGDPALALEIAGAYRRLAEIRGDSRGAHLGDPGSARRNAERAAALLKSMSKDGEENLAVLRERRILALLLGRMRLEGGDAAGIEETREAVRIAEAMVRLPDAGLAERRDLGATLAEYGGILAVVAGDEAAAAVPLARAVEELEALARDNPRDVPTRARLAYAYERAAIGAEVTGREAMLPRAIALLEQSIAATESAIAGDPENLPHRQTLVKRYNNAARVKLRAGDREGARRHAAAARARVEALLAADPGNVGNATMLAGVLATASEIELKDGRHERSMALAREAIAADARLPEATRAGLIVRENAAGAKRSLGASGCALAHSASLPAARRGELLREALAHLADSRAFKQELVDRGIDAADAARALAEIDAELAACRGALAELAGR